MKAIKNILLILSCLIGGCEASMAQTPVSPVQLTTNTPYLEPSTGLHWTYNGLTYLWWADLGLRDSTHYITPFYFSQHSTPLGTALLKANNLSDVANTVTSLSNLNGVPQSRTLTINGTTQDLSTNRTYTVTSSTTNPLTIGYGHVGQPLSFNGSVPISDIIDSAIIASLAHYNGIVPTWAINRYQTLSNLETTVTNSTSLYPSGSAVLSALGGYLAKLNPTVQKTANYNAAAQDFVLTNTTSNTVQITLPNAPIDGTLLAVKMVVQGAGLNTTIITQGVDIFNKTGGGTTLTLQIPNQGVLLQYQLSTHLWLVLSDDLSLASLDLRYGQLANPLSQFASTTSAQLASVLSDESGTGFVAYTGSPAFTGTPTSPTATLGTNTTQLATTAFVQSAVSALTTGVSSVIGTTNRISVSPTTGIPQVDISASYVGQTSITTLGTIGTGTWQGTLVSPTFGGTGINNGAKTITLGGNLTTSGTFNTTLTATATTSVTLPTSGTLYGTAASSFSSANLSTSLSTKTGTAGNSVFSITPSLSGTGNQAISVKMLAGSNMGTTGQSVGISFYESTGAVIVGGIKAVTQNANNVALGFSSYNNVTGMKEQMRLLGTGPLVIGDTVAHTGALLDVVGTIGSTALTASKVVFTDANKVLTSTGIGNSSQVILADGTLGTYTASPVTSVTNSDGTLTISPTTGAVVASLNLANNNIWTGLNTGNINGTGNTTVILRSLTNTQAATSGATQQWSPAESFHGTAWNGSISQTQDAKIYLKTTNVGSGNTQAQINLDYSVNGGTYTNKFMFDNLGNFTASGLTTTNTIQWNANSIVQASLTIPKASIFGFLDSGTGNTAGISGPSGIASSFNLIMPNALPTSTQVLTVNTSGNIGYSSSSPSPVSTLLTGQTGAATVTTITTDATGTNHVYRIGGTVNISTATTDVLNFQVTYTDDSSTNQTLTLGAPLATTGNLTSTPGTQTDYALQEVNIIVKANTTLTIKTILQTGGGSITYAVQGTYQELL